MKPLPKCHREPDEAGEARELFPPLYSRKHLPQTALVRPCTSPPALNHRSWHLKPVQVFCELPIPATALYTTRATMRGFCLQILALMNSLITLLHGPAEPSGC